MLAASLAFALAAKPAADVDRATLADALATYRGAAPALERCRARLPQEWLQHLEAPFQAALPLVPAALARLRLGAGGAAGACGAAEAPGCCDACGAEAAELLRCSRCRRVRAAVQRLWGMIRQCTALVFKTTTQSPHSACAAAPRCRSAGPRSTARPPASERRGLPGTSRCAAPGRRTDQAARLVPVTGRLAAQHRRPAWQQ